MDVNYQIIPKRSFTDYHRKTLALMLKKQRKVGGDLNSKVDRCKLICIASINDETVGIAAIKKPTRSDFSTRKANLISRRDQFDWELGYIYTDDDFTGRGIASNMVKLLIKEYGSSNLMASTEVSANPSMVHILKSNGFVHYGTPWPSDQHDDLLGLFLKYC